MALRDTADRVTATLKPAPPSKGEPLHRKLYRYILLKAARIPSIIIPPFLKKNIDRKTDAVAADWNAGSQQAHDLGVHFRQVGRGQNASGSDLIPPRVHRWVLKGYDIVPRKVHPHKAGSFSFEITPLPNKTEHTKNQEDKKQDELWRDLAKFKEERHFQIGRITKYFS